jgi:hypothetical protein
MTKKILRQGLTITLKELEDLKKELIQEQQELQRGIGEEEKIDYNQRFLIFIINKQSKCSDTWEIESFK